MQHIVGVPREQLVLLPEAVDDYVGKDNPVRCIEAFIENLDLSSLAFKKADLAETGRPPYNPADLLKLFLYGYLNRVRSSRRLEQETRRNLEVIWLMKKLSPDHKTISNFRKDNHTALRSVCRQFVMLCQDLNLFGAELIAIDGSKFAASNSNNRNITKSSIPARIRRIEETIDNYLKLLEATDSQDESLRVKQSEPLEQKIQSLKNLLQRYRTLQEDLEKKNEPQVSLTDPDSRMMDDHGRRDVSYNVQTAVDSKHKLIVDFDVTNESNDRALLAPMAKGAKEVLGVDHLEVCADKGYWSGTQIKECDDANILTYIPEHASTGKRKTNIPTPDFEPSKFTYDKENDTVRCPNGELLHLTTTTKVHKRLRFEYRTPACAGCPVKAHCTTSKTGRRIYRSEMEEVLQAARIRFQKSPEKSLLRKTLAEHPFGTLKRTWNQGYFLTRGLSKVTGEMSLSVLAYNFRRVISILTVSTVVNIFMAK